MSSHDARARLRELLGPWQGEIYHFPTLGSTNDWMKEAARHGLPEWSVAIADLQTAGRGRHGRTWISPLGNLYLSVLLRPVLPAGCLSLLPLAAGLAVAAGVEAFGAAPRLKWPNDVVVEGRKLAGILVESSSGSGAVEAAVVGVGVNIVASLGGAPPELAPLVTSLEDLTGDVPPALDVAAKVLGAMAVWYHALSDEPPRVVEEWRRRAVTWWGRPVEVRSGLEVIEGIAEDVDDRGALVVRKGDGSRVALLSGDARELRLADRTP